MKSSSIFNILFLSLGLLLIISQSYGLDEPDEQAKPAAAKKHSWSGFFNFKDYKQKYGRHYSSLVEEINREKIFMKNLLNSYVSKTRFRSKTSDKYLAVNDLSDRNDAELQATLIKPEILYEDLGEMIPDEKFEEKNQGDSSKGDTNKRSWISGLQKKMDNAISKFNDKASVFMNNMDNVITQLRVEMPVRRKDLPDEIFIDHRKSNCLNTVRNQGQCGSCSIFSTTALYEWAYCKMSGKKVRFSEQYTIDCGIKVREKHLLWGESRKLFGCNGNAPKEVGNFARDFGFELLHEYAYEAKHGQCPFEFSGKKPVDEMGAIRMGTKRAGLKFIAFREIEDYLKIAPVLISIRMSDDAFQYGGGLDDGAGCEKKPGFHSMLIVGSGRQDGYEYWIIRNSYSTQWGENGYYRLKKKNNCYMVLANGLVLDTIDLKNPSLAELKGRVEPLTRLASSKAAKFVEFVENPKHDQSLIRDKRRKTITMSELMNLE